MKVIHLISGGDSGGAKTHVYSLLHGLQGRLEAADMICFMEGPFAEGARELGIPTTVIAHRNPFRTLRELKEIIQNGEYDIIHCHGSRANLMGAFLKRSTHLPVVTTVHSDYHLDYLGRPISRLIYGSLNTAALRLLPYHIGVSDATVRMLISRGFDPYNVFPIYNGLDFSERAPAFSREEYLSSLGLNWPDDAVIVGIAARLDPVKDISTLIRGFAKAHQSAPCLRLLIAGSGQEEASLKSLASSLGLSEEVCFAGWVEDTDSFYHSIDINTLTSLSETFPYALTEGARYALPTVSTQVGGVSSLISHGINGYLIPPGDKDALAQHLTDLAGSAALRQKLGRRLLEKAQREFSLDRTLQCQAEIYETILRRVRRPERRKDGVIICGAYGRGNAGDEAILDAILQELKVIDPDLPIWVMSRSPKDTRLLHRTNAVYTFNVAGFIRRMSHSRLYINGGGSLMQDATSRRSLWFYLYTLNAARRRGCKVMMYGCGIGPISVPRNQKKARNTINRAVDVITLRDRSSLEELNKMGISDPEIILSADPAVILPAAPPETAEGLLENLGLSPSSGEHYLGISVRPWSGFSEKAPVFAAAADYCFQTYGLIPVFLPIEPRQDLPASQEVADHLQSAPYAIFPGSSSSEETIALFSRMDVVISMRLHALVFSAGHGIPLVGAVYDPKVSSFLDSIGQDLYVPFDGMTLDRLKPSLDRAVASIQNRSELEEGARKLLRLEEQNSIQARRLLGE